jgi:hypothetical protein
MESTSYPEMSSSYMTISLYHGPKKVKTSDVIFFPFDMCCSVHFCDNNFYNQQILLSDVIFDPLWTLSLFHM